MEVHAFQCRAAEAVETRELEGARRLEQIARVSLRPSRAIQSEADRTEFESVS